ncbi:hypothetical protein SCARD494_08026 [Seiridium cardinale]
MSSQLWRSWRAALDYSCSSGQLRQLRHRRPSYGISNAAQAGNKTTKNRFTRASERHSTNSRDGTLYGKASTPTKTVTGTSRTNHGHNTNYCKHSADNGNGHPLRVPTTTADVNVVPMAGLPVIVVILGMLMIFACASRQGRGARQASYRHYAV